MQSTGFLDTKPRRPGAMIAVVAVHAVGISALMMIAPTVIERINPPLEGYNVPAPTIPPEIIPDPAPRTEAKQKRTIEQPQRQVETKSADTGRTLTPDPGPRAGTGSGEGLGGGIDIIDIDPPKDPVIVAPQFTGRNAQPPYPASLQRLEIEGAVTLRVLVGADGRPQRIEVVRTDHEGFFNATRDWAMRNWRFKPATRDGVPYAEWRTMTVRFNMTS